MWRVCWWRKVLPHRVCYFPTSQSSHRYVLVTYTDGFLTGWWRASFNFSSGYHEVARLPVGSVGINVTENGVSNSYLGRDTCWTTNLLALISFCVVVRSGRSASHYFVNGGWSLSQPGVYPAAGTSIYYRRSQSSFETIWISGPLKEPLVLMVRLAIVECNLYSAPSESLR